jgi:hypothetical protein
MNWNENKVELMDKAATELDAIMPKGVKYVLIAFNEIDTANRARVVSNIPPEQTDKVLETVRKMHLDNISFNA